MPTFGDFSPPASLDGTEKIAGWKDGKDVGILLDQVVSKATSFAEIARKNGIWGVLPTDSDAVALNKFADFAITQNPGFKSTTPGPAGPSFPTIAQFKAAPISNRKQTLIDPLYPFADYYFETDAPPYVENIPNVIAADSTPLSVGAWKRQSAAGIVYAPAGVGATDRTMQDRGGDFISVKDFGAIGDGTPHPVSQWLVGGPLDRGFASLAAIQAQYPDVTSLTDQIDYAAINAALRYAVANGKGIDIPAGDYLAWIKAWFPKVSIRGQGSSCTTLKIPDGSTHTIPRNNAGGGVTVTGVPCVVDFNCIGHGNEATPMEHGHISGLTLDGNVSGTSVPSFDLFGWGLSFTAYSNVTYHDIVAINTHCGGIGTFINSNFHKGEARIYNCGNSPVGGGTRPGFDVNSSKNSTWSFIAEDCAYGGRLLDNCSNNIVQGVVRNATRSGFICDNQSVNSSVNLVVDVTIYGGCADQGLLVGANVTSSTFRAVIASIYGIGAIESEQSGSLRQRGNSYTIISKNCGLQSCVIGGDSGIWDISSTEDGRTGTQGSSFAVDVKGDHNTLYVGLTDTAPWQVRGIVFRSGADYNRLVSYRYTNTANPLSDSGIGNITVGAVPDTGWTASTGTAAKGAYATYAGQTVSGSYTQTEVQATDNAVKALSQRLKAIEDTLRLAGVIG